MTTQLPKLIHKDMVPTRNYIQEVAHVLGALQRSLVKRDPHDWYYGLEVGPRGLTTQQLTLVTKEVRASLDLVRHKVRLDGSHQGADKFQHLCLGRHGVVHTPTFRMGTFRGRAMVFRQQRTLGELCLPHDFMLLFQFLLEQLHKEWSGSACGRASRKFTP